MLRLALKVQACTNGCGNDDWELPLPPRPAVPPPGRGEEKLECCGGSLIPCHGCGKLFKLYVRLRTHKRESCPANAEAQPTSRICGKRVIQRHLTRHGQSKRCPAARAREAA